MGKDGRQASLLRAMAEKNDEFYTRYEDVENELKNYDLSGKTVYCPCDDFRWSEIVRYFRHNFERHGLKRLIATNYDIGEGAYIYIMDSGCEFAFKCTCDGDYKRYGHFFDECDVVCTNPPFSKWREFASYCLFEKEKDVIILGSLNVAGYGIFNTLVMQDRLRLGFTMRGSTKQSFTLPDGTEKTMSNAVWWTTLPSLERGPLTLTERFDPSKYPVFDNYPDIINVDRTKDIPFDYDGLMGVPMSFLNYWNREQFDIVDGIGMGGYKGDGYVDGKRKYSRFVIRRTGKIY